MPNSYTLNHEGKSIAEWTIPRAWMPSMGTLLVVKHEGRMQLFRAMRLENSTIFLALYS